MSVWDTYNDRVNVRGITKRETVLNREVRTLLHKVPDSLSYHLVTIYDNAHGYNITSEEMAPFAKERNVAVINSDNLYEKTIIALPGEDIEHGSLVFWMDNYWLVTERDANTTVYTKGKMIQCNYLLRWVTDKNKVCEQWSVIEDGTKYLTGEFEDRNFITTRGDSRICMSIARNEETVKLGRTNRFIIDDDDAPRPLTYTLSKPLKLGGSFNHHGIFKFVLQEVASTDDDNLELRIADYYKHFPKAVSVDIGEGPVIDTSNTSDSGKKVWL